MALKWIAFGLLQNTARRQFVACIVFRTTDLAMEEGVKERYRHIMAAFGVKTSLLLDIRSFILSGRWKVETFQPCEVSWISGTISNRRSVFVVVFLFVFLH